MNTSFFRKIKKFLTLCFYKQRTMLMETLFGQLFFNTTSSTKVLKRMLSTEDIHYEPLTGQRKRKEVFDYLINSFNFPQIIETGTHMGDTTKYFSEFGKKVFSAEINELYYAYAKKKLHCKENINLYNVDSISLLSQPSDFKINTNELTFIYLDAHGQSYLPLLDELCLIQKLFKSYFIVIDDFCVENRPEFIYDRYGMFVQKRLNYNYIKKHVQNLTKFFPSYAPEKEGSVARGYICLTNLDSISDQIKSNYSDLKLFNK